MIGKIMGLVHLANYVSNCGRRFFAVYFIFVLFIFMYMKQYRYVGTFSKHACPNVGWILKQSRYAQGRDEPWPLNYSAPTLETSNLLCSNSRDLWPNLPQTLVTADLLCSNSHDLWPNLLQLSWPLTYCPPTLVTSDLLYYCDVVRSQAPDNSRLYSTLTERAVMYLRQPDISALSVRHIRRWWRAALSYTLLSATTSRFQPSSYLPELQIEP